MAKQIMKIELRSDLRDVLKVVSGEIFGASSGIHTWPGTDGNNQQIFDWCVELEELGFLYRKTDEPGHVFFDLVKDDEAKTKSTED